MAHLQKTHSATRVWWKSGGRRPCERCGIDLKDDSRKSTMLCPDCCNDPFFRKARNGEVPR